MSTGPPTTVVEPRYNLDWFCFFLKGEVLPNRILRYETYKKAILFLMKRSFKRELWLLTSFPSLFQLEILSFKLK